MAYYISSGVISTGMTAGDVYIYDGGIANNTYVGTYGEMHISRGGVANSTSVAYDGVLYVSSGGTANITTMSGYTYYVCEMHISSGGVANSTTMNNSCFLFISSGGVANSTTVNRYFCDVYIYAGGVANRTTVNSGSVRISSGGVANSTFVNCDGQMHISSGGVANSTAVNSDGRVYISSAGKHTGELDIFSGGVVSALAGAIIDFDISNRTTESNALINNLSFIQGTPEYTITVAAQQADGIYKLAKGASAFSGSITVYADGSVLGTLGVNETLKVNNTEYRLDLANDLLQFTVVKKAPSGFSYCGGNGGTINENIEMLVDGGTFTRLYGGNYVDKSKQFVDIAGSIDLTVNSGTFSSVVAGGDHVVDGIVERTGSITVVINGGTFANNVAGGMCLDIAADNFGQVNAIANDINLTITGGTFAKRVFGGNISAKVAQSGHADVKGNINLTIDATASDITFSENIAAGSSGYSWVHGNVTVTLKKSASYTLDMQGLLSGGGEGAVYVSSSDGSRSATSYVAGERTLVLDSYVGEFAGTLFMFESLEVKNNTAIEFTNEKINLRDITSWDIEYGSSLDGIARNNFTDDTLDFDLTGWNNAEDWIVMSGSENAFDTIAEAENVILGGQTATWNGSAWASADYTLTIEENNQKLVLAKVNA